MNSPEDFEAKVQAWLRTNAKQLGFLQDSWKSEQHDWQQFETALKKMVAQQPAFSFAGATRKPFGVKFAYAATATQNVIAHVQCGRKLKCTVALAPRRRAAA